MAQITEILNEYGFTNITDTDKYGSTVLHLTVINKKYTQKEMIEVLKIFLERGVSVDTEDKSRRTPIEIAIENEEDVGIVVMLIEHSTNINKKKCDCDTLFHIVVRKWINSSEGKKDYYLKIAQALLAKGADMNEADKCGKPPVELLEENGADLRMRTEDGETLIHLLIKGENCWKTGDDEAEMKLFKLLIRKGCQVNAKDKAGTALLHVAAMHSNARVVQMLIEHGARVNCKNNEMETPLHFATRNRKVEEVAELLLRHGAYINAQDAKGQTPLHKIAIQPKSEHSHAGLEILLQYGADVNVRDLNNCTALRCARSRDIEAWEQQRQDWVDKANESRRQIATQNDNNDPPQLLTIDQCPIKDTISHVVTCLKTKSFELLAANLPWDRQVQEPLGEFFSAKSTARFNRLYLFKSLSEVESLKSTLIDDHTSLYDFIHMDINRKTGYVHNEKLKQLVQCRLNLKKIFCIYADLIITSYREVLLRKVFLEQASRAWLELTEIQLPAICLDLIFSYLSNSELFGMLTD